mgnify:CR=1 FL=1|jgi:hypothetical protein
MIWEELIPEPREILISMIQSKPFKEFGLIALI